MNYADACPPSVVPKQEPASTMADYNTASPPASEASAGDGVRLADYSPSTSKGHEILSHVYQLNSAGAGSPIRLVAVKARRYPARPSKTPVSRRPS